MNLQSSGNHEQAWTKNVFDCIVVNLRCDVHRGCVCTGKSFLDSNYSVSGWKDGNNIVVCYQLRLLWWVMHYNSVCSSDAAFHYDFPSLIIMTCLFLLLSWNAANIDKKRRGWNILNVFAFRSTFGSFRAASEALHVFLAASALRCCCFHIGNLGNFPPWNAWNETAWHDRRSGKHRKKKFANINRKTLCLQ